MSGIYQAWSEENQITGSTNSMENAKSNTRLKKMENQEDCIVWGALSLVMRLSKLGGVAPVQFVTAKDGVRMKISTSMTIWNYLLAFGLTVVLVTSFVMDMNLSKEHAVRVSTQMACTIWVIDLTIMLVITNMGAIGSNSRIKEMISIINNINSIIVKLNNNRPFQQAEKNRCAFVITWVSGAVILCVCDMYTFVYEALYHGNDLLVTGLMAFYYISGFTTVVLELQYIFVAMLIGTAFKQVNGALLELLFEIDTVYVRRPKGSGTEGMNSTSIDHNLLQNLVNLMDKTNFDNVLPTSRITKSRISVHRLNLAYTGICNIARQFYKSNGVMLLVLLMSFLIHLVVTPYYFISYLFTVQENTGRKFAIYLQFAWCLHHATKVFSLMEPGHVIFQEIERTKVLIGQLMIRMDMKNDPLMVELELFQRQITLNTVSCSPLGMCVLTRPLIATVLSGLTTYFVIIIQFKSKEK